MMEIEILLKAFRFNLNRLMDLEDRLQLLAYELNGDNIGSPKIKSPEEAKYQTGTKIYKNNIPELMMQESKLIKERDYYLFAVKKVETFLQRLTDEEVKLIELRYWHGFNINQIARMYFWSKRTTYRKFDMIFEKLAHVPSIFVV
ncbi:hypothetical protein EII25_03410 [Erysipelotrichaceae bacterium OH741_COT-311]|nr:hypothetical protein EII25_03410 [Erysipelotrichaceae bacterium OH741_COT-311]